MKPSEIKALWKLVKSGETRKLTAAELALLLRVRYAIQQYQLETNILRNPKMKFL